MKTNFWDVCEVVLDWVTRGQKPTLNMALSQGVSSVKDKVIRPSLSHGYEYNSSSNQTFLTLYISPPPLRCFWSVI